MCPKNGSGEEEGWDGLLRILSDRDDRRIFFDFEVFDSGIFLASIFLVGLVLVELFLGIQKNLKICGGL